MRHPCLPAALAALVLAGGALAGCDAPQGAAPPISAAAARAPEPRLLATARFDSALAQAQPDAERLGGDRDTLAARAAALRSRAAALGTPVMDADERARLDAGVASPPAIPPSDPDPDSPPSEPDAGTP